ncbi:MAG: PD-(D/E)XK nuclease family protein [Nitrospiraceae bacterium]|nr:MAG: PD-(D/E)XK nuclease family protein [Nitrospiraceae bacterium]
MKHTTLLIAPLGAKNKKEAIFNEIVSLCPGNDFSRVLYLAPNTTVLTEAKARFFSCLKKERGKSAYIPFQTFTIKQLARHLHETNPPLNSKLQTPNSVISDRMRTLTLCGMLKEKNIGYASLLSDLFRKIRHYTPDKDLPRLTDEIRQLIFEDKTKDRAVRAMELLQEYERFLEEKKLIDPDDMIRNCVSLPHALCPMPLTLVVDGFLDPTPLELEIIKTLFESADKAVILAEENTELLRYFLSLKEGMTVKKLESSLRRETTGYYSYNSMEEEVEGIARNVKKLVLEGVRPWEVTVCFPSLSQYLPMLRRVFAKHAIPADIGERSLSATGPFVVLEEMIACMEDDYPRNEFLSLLTSPCFPAIDDEVKKRAVTLSYRAGIIKGKEVWLSIEDILISSNDISDEEKTRIREFQKGIMPVIAALEEIKNSGGITAYIDAFESALDKLGFFDYLKNPPLTPSPLERGAGVCDRGEFIPPLKKGDEGGFFDHILHSITNLFSDLRQFAGWQGTALKARDAGFYLRYLLQDLSAPDENIDGVRVIPFELAAAVGSKALFFGGVTEGSFPSRPGIDPVLPEKVKKTLGLPDLEYYLERQRAYFMRLLNVSAFDPYISCPSADGDKIFLPSPYLDWEKAICPPDLNIFTEEDVLVREGPGLRPGNEKAYFDAKATGMLRGRINAMSKKYFRVTDLDYYRKCPFRFYIEKVLGLEMGKPPRFEVEYRQWGNIAHRTMENLFKGGDWGLDEFEERLFSALNKSLKELPLGPFWASVTGEIFRNLLPMLKKQEAEIRMEGFSPWLIEEKIEAEIDGIKLRGKIDRIDKEKSEVRSQKSEVKQQRTTDDGQRRSVILLDYKTGSIDRKSLQLPLYARMWQESRSEQVLKTGYYSLKEGRVSWYPSKNKSLEEIIREALQEATALIEQMKKGLFPAEPDNNECRNCGHDGLCEK